MTDSAPDSEAVVRALADPATYAHAPARVAHVQTHISHVFLADPFVYKLKKPVAFPFLDFGTPERRRHFCEEEVRLNRRLCPDVYLGVLPVTRAADGRIRLEGSGTVLDHVVWMRRLPEDRVLPALLARAEPLEQRLDELARLLVRFHAEAPHGPDVAQHAAPDRLAAAWLENLAGARGFVGRLLGGEEHEILCEVGPHFVRRHEALLRARQEAGRIREGHGDLQAAHVFVLDAPVAAAGLPPLAPGLYVFDCIEFSLALRCADVAAEVAFLAMDLARLGAPALADRFVGTYATAAGDSELHRLLPFYACARACVRGKVEGLRSEEPEVASDEREAAAGRARGYFALALRCAWQACGPAIVACAGRSGTGKSTLAAALAEATGSVLLSSDALRKRDATAAVRYRPEDRAAVYETLCAEAGTALATERSVVADATWMRRADRDRLAAVARAAGRPWVFVECEAAESVVRERLAARERVASVSDARWDTYLAQRSAWEPFGADEPHIAVDTGEPATAARVTALRALWRWHLDAAR